MVRQSDLLLVVPQQKQLRRHALSYKLTCCSQEEFFMEHSVDKAISIDEWTGETLSSSMVDDVFYILRMCSCRALDTANLQALTAVLGQLNTLLASNLAQALDQRWKVLSCTAALLCYLLLPTCHSHIKSHTLPILLLHRLQSQINALYILDCVLSPAGAVKHCQLHESTGHPSYYS